MQILDGEKAYNDANLDQYLMGIKKLKVEKKKLPKLLPSLSVAEEPNKKRIKLSKREEQLYKQYSDINETISAQRISEDDVNQNLQFRV